MRERSPILRPDQPGRRPTVLVLAVHPATVASTRLRAEQYRAHLDAAGVDLSVWSFIPAALCSRWLEGGVVDRLVIAALGLPGVLRLPMALRRASMVVVQREALPFGPPVFEWLAARRRPMVWDIDDARWATGPASNKVARMVLGRSSAKYERMASMATEVWAGSEVLANWCRPFNSRVRVVPTVVEVPPLDPSAGRRPNRVVGWIGSPSTAPFLAGVLPALAQMEAPPRVMVVGGQVDPVDGLDMTVRPWSPEAEEELLASIAVGLYPIDRSHPLAEGKCGLKAILYLSRGISVVLTPTTTNAAIVENGVGGLHAERLEEWRDAVGRLLDDSEERNRLAGGGHRRVAEEYSLGRWGPTVASRVLELMGK